MKIVTVREMFLSTIGDDRVLDVKTFESSVVNSRNFDIKWEQHLEYSVLARKLGQLFRGKKAYIHFHEFGVWPSSENWHLFRALCHFCLQNKEFDLHCCIEFLKADGEALTSFLQLGLQFGWGGLIISDIDHWFYFSHDSWGCLASSSEADAALAKLY